MKEYDVTHCESETEAFGAKLAQRLKAGDCVTLSGELGAGKTALARGLIRALAGEAEVTSPTFALMQPYDLKRGGTLWHCDFYRLERESELDALGLEDLFPHSIFLVEWPQIAVNRLPRRRLEVTLDFGEGADERRIRVTGG
jgi:tRNA threonylcarbamoyl adenosine modification protein YjeE